MNLRIKFALILCSLCVFSFGQNVDIDILRKINLERNRAADPVVKFISDSASPVSISLPIMMYSVGLVAKDSTIKSKALYMAASVVGASLLSTSLKYIINRDRPFVSYIDIEKLDSGGSPSFPSGHTSTAFSTATSLSIAYPKWYVIAPSYLWASAVGYSRMHLGVHYPSDVLVGAFVGSGSAFICHRINRYLRTKSQKRSSLPLE